ncbi:MAG: leucine-rich repeat domain-containing protein [Bacteroidia bacterium]|nr:leucine-rich repeat domain-containing protein [Bacteroidia bacterium]
MKALREIDLYFNQIEHIPDNITRLTNLQILYISNNKLAALPESIGNMQSLRELYVSSQQIKLPARQYRQSEKPARAPVQQQ